MFIDPFISGGSCGSSEGVPYTTCKVPSLSMYNLSALGR